MTHLEQAVSRSLEQSKMLAAGDRVAVAVSGGADSVAMLRLLHSLRDKLGITLCVAHFDHRLRGAASKADAKFVEELSHSLALAFVYDTADVQDTAKRERWNLEDAARRLRYAFFARLVKEGRASHVAVAHTADDQAETVLARLLRGCGPAGLASIQPRLGAIIRPFLGVRRTELRSYLRQIQQPWREDATNEDLSRQRARIRSKLVPALESEFSPTIVEHLCRLARLARQDEEFWIAFVKIRINELARVTKGSISVSAAALLSPLAPATSNDSRHGFAATTAPELPALSQRMIRECFLRVRARGELSATHVEQILRLARVQSGRRIELPGDVLVHNRLGQIVFERANKTGAKDTVETHSGPSPFHYHVALPTHGFVAVPVPELHTCFRLKLIDWPCLERETRGQQGVLDVERLHPPLFLRSWQPGDAYRPCARHRPLKLKRMLLEARVPKEQRPAWPVLESGGKVVWARSMPPAEGYGAGSGTKQALIIEESAV